MKTLKRLLLVALLGTLTFSCEKFEFDTTSKSIDINEEPSQNITSLASGSNIINYQQFGMIHNDFLSCVMSESDSWNFDSFSDASELTAQIFITTQNCSYPWFSYQSSQFSYSDIFNVHYLEEQVAIIQSSSAFSKEGKNIISTLASYYFKETTPYDEESKAFLTGLISKFEQTSFRNSVEKEVVGGMLYLTQGSVEFWESHEYFDLNGLNNPEIFAAHPAAVDVGGMIASVAWDATDGQLSADKIDDHIIAGVVASSGVIGKIGKAISKFFA
ncbi:hypothetical protein JKA74_18035 [Marivirga sp. S37H4]|uniref:Uncharacterized protein n=1 Tax=Marivirga aurantiaca TaxID=2802615 RepID=A0A935CB86_9BACT|nr:hypothetical protein [Marivirga aurantiaca]MBK6266949.1 hypothetical protein [Marivirga aurantiaca]